MKARAAKAAAAIAIASLGSTASACGFCDEDRIAAVYDHAVIARALERHYRVVYFAIEGAMPDAARSRRLVSRALQAAKGIDARSGRISIEPASLGVAYDPKRTRPEEIATTLNRELALAGLVVSVLRVMETQIAPPPSRG